MLSLKIASAIITLFRKKCSNDFQSVWVEWRETVLNILDKEAQFGSIHAAVNAGKVLASKKDAEKHIQQLVSSASQEELVTLTDYISLYEELYIANANYVEGLFEKQKLNNLLEQFQLSPTKGNEKSKVWVEKQRDQKFKTKYKVKGTSQFILLDLLLRFITFAAYVRLEFDTGLFWTSQVIFIPSIVLVLAIIRDVKIKRRTADVLQSLKVSDVELRSLVSAWQYMYIFCGAVILIVAATHVNNHNHRISEGEMIAALLLGALQFLYLLLLQNNWAKCNPSISLFKKQKEIQEHLSLKEDLSAEENDEEIIHLEVNLKAENERMDAYVIEAALFGALAFSGFLQLVSSDNFSLSFIAKFNESINQYLFVLLDSRVNNTSLVEILGNKQSLTVVMCYLALFCSIFFLAVIASRLRYSSLTDFIDRALQLSKAYNQKEEALVLHDSTAAGKYTKLIKEQLKEGYKKQNQIKPIMEYMMFFRTLGIVTFFVIIIFGGFFLSGVLSFILFLIASLSFFYFKLNNIKTAIKQRYIALQEYYYSNSKRYHLVAWALVGVGVMLRTCNLPFGNVLLILGTGLLFIHYLLNLVIPVEFDFEFSENDDVFSSKLKKYKILHVIFKVALAIFFTGFLFKTMRWIGADILIVCSTFLFILYFTFTPKMKGSPKWLSWIISSFSTLFFLGLIFKILNWRGAGVIALLGYALAVISVVLCIKFWKQIRSQIQKSLVVMWIFAVIFTIPYLRHSVITFNFNYQSFELASVENELKVSVWRSPKEVEVSLKKFEKLVMDNPDINHIWRMTYVLDRIDQDYNDSANVKLLYQHFLPWADDCIKKGEETFLIDYALLVRAYIYMEDYEKAQEYWLEGEKRFLQEIKENPGSDEVIFFKRQKEEINKKPRTYE